MSKSFFGRKRIADQDRKSHTVSVALDDDTYFKLVKIAKSDDRAASYIIRNIIMSALAYNETPKNERSVILPNGFPINQDEDIVIPDSDGAL